jgi:peptidoglycan/xylan/chitin deacetylase (PgdA/CDA1 family)
LYNSITDVENLLVDDITPTEANAVSVEVEDLVTYSLQKGKVALTFDDGPSTQTVQIVDTLKEYGVGGTFFFVGQNVEKYPEHLLYTKLNGYSIASHSINHPDLRNLSTENQRYEVIGSIDLIEEIIEEEVTLFRPPYGAYDKRVMSLMEESNCKIVLWDNDPKDWESRNADSIFQHIQNTNVDGSIILFHETIATLEALPRIIEYLQSLDLEIVI